MLTILSGFEEFTEVTFLGDRGQIELIQLEGKSVLTKPVAFIPKYVHPKVGGRAWIAKIWHEFNNVFALLRTAPEESLIFFCSLSPITSFFYKLIKRFYPEKKVVITLHGDIDFIQQNKTRLRNWLGKFFSWSFSMKDRKTKYLVLSNTIKKNLIREEILSGDELYAVNHPYVFDALNKQKKTAKFPVRIGHIGVASTEKNTQLLFTLAKIFEYEIKRNELSFSIIGMTANIDEFNNGLVEYQNDSEMLPKSLFNEKIAGLDYSIFFYSDQNYKFCSSGAILDSIHHRIPIISFKNQGFESLFSEAPGPVGYLCRNIDEMERVIRDILNKDVEADYIEMQHNLNAYQNNFTIDYVKEKLHEQLIPFIHAK
ncbi:hypothetical protein [Pedobacter ginsengisoli]|uniref:hypothetical protein n=1 Tax=Pedobacter ginsengisoli TaxID=363852 RepID=UPI00254B6C72|nr:hypothetical protein [Pedobacter ginsengisoli]